MVLSRKNNPYQTAEAQGPAALFACESLMPCIWGHNRRGCLLLVFAKLNPPEADTCMLYVSPGDLVWGRRCNE